MKAGSILLCFALLVGCSSNNALPDPYVVKADNGGNIREYQKLRAKLEAGGTTVRIEGYCLSSCTILYSLPKTCVMPGAKLAFHRSSTGAIGNAMLRPYYRGEVLRLFDKEWGRSTKLKYITGRQLKKLDPSVQLCR